MPPESWLGIRSWKPPRLTTSSLSRLMMRIVEGSSVVCSRSGNATFSPTVSDVSSAPPWNDTPMRRCRSSISRSLAVPKIDAEQLHRAAARPLQAEQMAQQRRLAGARSAHDHADFARMNDEIDAVQHATAAVPGFEVFDFDQWRGSRIHRNQATRLCLGAPRTRRCGATETRRPNAPRMLVSVS